MLTAEYGISHERLSQQLVNIAEKLVNDYWDNHSGDILNIVDGSFFDDYDSSGKELQFKAAATMSVTYTLLERCGFEPEGYFDKDDFQAIHTFSTPDAVYALGAATSDISREVLRKIERTVKTTTRRRNVERMEEYEQQSELHEDRGLPAPEPDPQPAEKTPLGKYGRMRRNYLKQYRPVLYNSMLLNGTLYQHLMELEQTAESRMQQTMEQLLKQDPAPDKAQNQLMWVQHMNSLKAQAEELVMTELIYS